MSSPKSKTLSRIACAGALILSLLWANQPVLAQSPVKIERRTTWHGFEQLHFTVAERDAYLVAPAHAAAGNPWVWRARFPNYHSEMDIQLLKRGFHVAYVDVSEFFGNPASVSIGGRFYEVVTTQFNLSHKPAMEGVSRGGLFVYNWAAAHPDRVSCIYCDTPVCDIRSWPGGFGKGLGDDASWRKCLAAYGLTAREAEGFQGNPLDHAPKIAAARIPILHVVSEDDQIVPAGENTLLLKRLMEEHRHELELITVPHGTPESHGHHFTHPEPDRVVEFISKHAESEARLELLTKAKRILFLGDSITYQGEYVCQFEAWLELQRPIEGQIVINAGLPSETVSGLSEDNHAGGQFPRPKLAERLDRVLQITKPDLIFACYGMNCGIYQPFDESRFEPYQQGLELLKSRAKEEGAQLILLTPPVFDDRQSPRGFSYNAVLDRYSDWLLSQRRNGWHVVDVHHPMSQELERRRQAAPEFTFQSDGVHPDSAGHQFIASTLIRWFDPDATGLPQNEPVEEPGTILSPEARALIRERHVLRRDAFLSAAGHQRPGLPRGKPLDEMETRVNELTAKLLQELLQSKSDER